MNSRMNSPSESVRDGSGESDMHTYSRTPPDLPTFFVFFTDSRGRNQTSALAQQTGPPHSPHRGVGPARRVKADVTLLADTHTGS